MVVGIVVVVSTVVVGSVGVVVGGADVVSIVVVGSVGVVVGGADVVSTVVVGSVDVVVGGAVVVAVVVVTAVIVVVLDESNIYHTLIKCIFHLAGEISSITITNTQLLSCSRVEMHTLKNYDCS